jgi:hypothetical protein
MSNIIEKFGIKPLLTCYRSGSSVRIEEVRKVEQQRGDLLQLLDDIIVKQYDPLYRLTDLAKSIRTARTELRTMFPKIKEFYKC